MVGPFHAFILSWYTAYGLQFHECMDACNIIQLWNLVIFVLIQNSLIFRVAKPQENRIVDKGIVAFTRQGSQSADQIVDFWRFLNWNWEYIYIYIYGDTYNRRRSRRQRDRAALRFLRSTMDSFCPPLELLYCYGYGWINFYFSEILGWNIFYSNFIELFPMINWSYAIC